MSVEAAANLTASGQSHEFAIDSAYLTVYVVGDFDIGTIKIESSPNGTDWVLEEEGHTENLAWVPKAKSAKAGVGKVTVEGVGVSCDLDVYVLRSH